MDPLVSVAWLAAQMGQRDVAVLDATLPPVGVFPAPDVRARYLAQHIPGAVFFDIEALSDHGTSLPHMLPSPESFAHSLSELGLSERMTLVVYEQEGVFSAPRAWWMLRTMGAQNVHVLDGGLQAWREAGEPTESGAVVRPPAQFQASFDGAAVRSFAQVQDLLAAREQILDARSSGRFAGSAPEPRPGLRSGHMPGALNVPFTELSEAGRLKSPDQLRAAFTARGVDLGRPVTTTCGSGVTAAVLALGLECCGVPQVTLYDGSWAEYAQQPEAVVLRDDR